MKKNSRVYAAIHLDALEQNLENMKKNLTPGTRMIGVIKANAYGHGAVPVAHLMEGKVRSISAINKELLIFPGCHNGFFYDLHTNHLFRHCCQDL